MNRLFLRAIVIGIVAIISFCTVAFLVISTSMERILKQWNQSTNQTLLLTVQSRLETIAQSLANTAGSEQNAQIGSEQILRQMGNLPSTPDYIMIMSPNNQVLYLNRLGSVPQGQGRGMLEALSPTADWRAITYAGKLWFRYAVRAQSLDQTESIQVFLAAIEYSALWALLIASLVALALAYLLSRPIARQARSLADSLVQMQQGQRAIAIPSGGIVELAAIARSAGALQESLKRESTLRQQWAADIAHDLRSPITVLKGQFEGMLDGIFAPDPERLQRNYQEVLQLEALVNQLAELSRLETPGYTVEAQMLDGRDLLSKLLERYNDSAKLAGYKLELLVPGQNCLVLADPVLLERALSNVIENALHYGKANSTIYLSLHNTTPGMLSFSVDNAGFIPPTQVAKLFDRLYRGDQSRSTPGAGLGLAIVQAICQVHGGSVAVSSDPVSQRTCFRLDFPTA